jgi:hypothetical protein
LQVQTDAAPPACGIDIKPWIAAASEFSLNTDFDVSSVTSTRRMDLKEIMHIMKDLSMGKRTIQAMADKLMLQRILQNMDVPQMPALLLIDGAVNPADIMKFVHGHLCGREACDVVIKPTHLSNGSGVIVVSRPKPEEVDSTINFLTAHIQQFLNKKAGSHESVALRSLKPGFIVQPKYQSVVGFKTPLELRCIVLWGRARLAVWWWGRGSAPGEFPHRNAWLIRRPTKRHSSSDPSCEDHIELTTEDSWEILHDHSGSNPGFDKALELFHMHIPAIAACAEALAVAVGAPFLRSDFFVGSSQWGVRLNEVAYGCGVDYMSRAEDLSMVDDGPAIARILQEGMAQCRCRLPPDHFLKRLGVKGNSYMDMSVTPLPAWARPALPAACTSLGVPSADDYVVPEELCRTIHPVWRGRHSRQSRCKQSAARSLSWDEGMAQAVLQSQKQSACSRNRSSSCSGRKNHESLEQLPKTQERSRHRKKGASPRNHGVPEGKSGIVEVDAVCGKSIEEPWASYSERNMI